MLDLEKSEDALKRLIKIQDDSRIFVHDKKKGKNKKIRSDAERELDHQIFLAKIIIKENNLLDLKLGKNRSNEDKALWMAEFPKYFEDDMKEFIKLLKGRIEKLKEDGEGETN
jgi:hypothetical protein